MSKRTQFQTILTFDNKKKNYITRKHFLQLSEREYQLNRDLVEFKLIVSDFLFNLYAIKKNLMALNSAEISDLHKVIILFQRNMVKTMIEYIDILAQNVKNLFEFILKDKKEEREKLAKIIVKLLYDDEYYYTVLYPKKINELLETEHGIITTKEFLEKKRRKEDA